MMVTRSKGMQVMSYEGRQICTIKFQGICLLDNATIYSVPMHCLHDSWHLVTLSGDTTCHDCASGDGALTWVANAEI